MFDFYYQQGSSRRKLFQVKGSHCSIGSARNNDLVLESRRLAKRHAEFRLEADGLHMRDLGSMSGTWVNRERIMDHGPLSDLDEIEVGDISLTIRAVRQSTTLPPSVGRLNGDQQQMSLSANEQDAGFENQAGRENEHALSGSQKPKLSVSDTGHGNSLSRASTIGLLSSILRPKGVMMRSMTANTVASLLNCIRDRSSFPSRSTNISR